MVLIELLVDYTNMAHMERKSHFENGVKVIEYVKCMDLETEKEITDPKKIEEIQRNIEKQEAEREDSDEDYDFGDIFKKTRL